MLANSDIGDQFKNNLHQFNLPKKVAAEVVSKLEMYRAEMLKELGVNLASVASEVGMFKRDAKAQTALKINSQAEETQLLKIVLDYAGCPPKEEESSCCIS